MADCVEGCTEEVAVCVEDFEGHCARCGCEVGVFVQRW